MMKDIKAVKGRYLIQRLVEEGEHERQDFKFAISDARKIARSISAFANHSGGCLLIGVKDNGAIAGVRNEEDIYVVEQAATMCCEPPQQVTFDAFKVEAGVVVIRATVEAADERPVRVIEADGTRRAYFRVADENIAAHPLMVRAWRHSRDDSGAQAFLLDDSATALLAAVRRAGGTAIPDRLPLELHRSARATDDIIVRLAAIGLLEFRYDGHRFAIAIPDND